MAKKHYFNIDEVVWVKKEQQRGVITKIYQSDDKTVADVNLEDGEHVTLSLKDLASTVDKEYYDGVIGFARFRESALIPSKASPEDAGYDVYLDFPKDYTYTYKGKTHKAWQEDNVLEVYLQQLTPNLLPTGVGVKVPKGLYTNWANERGSTGKEGMLILSGIVDSNYRGESFINISPLFNDILITNMVEEVEYRDNLVVFPYNKAVAQMIPSDNKQLRSYDIPLDTFVQDKTNRGANKLGSTDKK